MKRIIINIVLITTYVLLAAIVILPFFVELKIEKAEAFQNNYEWNDADKMYVEALRLDPFNSENFKKYGDFLAQRLMLKDAQQMYKSALNLNKKNGAYWLRFGNMKEAVKNDPNGFNVNYVFGISLLKDLDNLNGKDKKNTLDRLRHVVQIAPSIMSRVKDFEVLEKMIPHTLTGYKRLYKYIKTKNLWKYRRRVTDKVDYYRKKESAKEFELDKTEFEKLLQSLRIRAKNGNVKGWEGKSLSGRNTYKHGSMYWDGTIYTVINLEQGQSLISIKARKFFAIKVENPEDPKFFPYMLVKLDDEIIGEMFVPNDEWKDYKFLVKSNGGLKVLGVSFLNDVWNPKKEEDRNLQIGNVSVYNREGENRD